MKDKVDTRYDKREISKKEASQKGPGELTLDPDCAISLFWLSYGQILALFPNWECPSVGSKMNISMTYIYS